MFGSIAAAALAAAAPATVEEHQAACTGKDGWSDPAPPVKVFANVYDVGTCGIVSLLITGPRGHILLDGATAEAAPTTCHSLSPEDTKPCTRTSTSITAQLGWSTTTRPRSAASSASSHG